MKIDKPQNPEYCATVVQLEEFRELPNCDNVKGAIVLGSQVIVGKDTQAGDVGLYFPVETALSPEFLGQNNLYRKPEWGNQNPESKGYFEEHGRVRAVRFRGSISDGFFIPISALAYLKLSASIVFPIGATFDSLNGHLICTKYQRVQPMAAKAPKKRRGTGRWWDPRSLAWRERTSLASRLVPGQFAFHQDTAQLKRNAHLLEEDQQIVISKKMHGTSAVYANVSVKAKLQWWERALQWFGVEIMDLRQGFVWSSRTVIKGIDDGTMVDRSTTCNHFYGEDVWGVVGAEIKEKIPTNFSVYGEIVGFTPGGVPIQKGYHYGCAPKEHKFFVYKVTFTNDAGMVFCLPWAAMLEFCDAQGLTPVPTIYSGRVWNLNSRTLRGDDNWRARVIEQIEATSVEGRRCAMNNFEVPEEGVVVLIDRMLNPVPLKLKSFDFKTRESKQRDAGEPDLEADEAAVEAVEAEEPKAA